MRIDLFIKKTRIIKRREIAKKAITENLVFLNGQITKPGAKVKVGDLITVNYQNKSLNYLVESVDDKNPEAILEGENENGKVN